MAQFNECGISVLMPVHNGGEYLKAAVESILTQTHQKIELILIDDHSTDDSIEKLSTDSRLRIIQSPSKGIVAALNHGAAEASYSIIARMDADDISLANRLATQLDLLLRSHEPIIVGAQVALFSDKHEIAEGYRRYQGWINQQTSSKDISNNFWVESCIPHPSAMFHKSTLIELGGYHDPPWPEDYDLWCRAHLAGYKFAKPDTQILLRWRDYQNRTSRIDERYSKDQFLRCKARYLSEQLLRSNNNQCVIWGTGPTGTKLHNYLVKHKIHVSGFVDVNPKLVGREKYGKPIHVISDKPNHKELSVIRPMGLIAVSSWGAREKIREVLVANNYQESEDFILVA